MADGVWTEERVRQLVCDIQRDKDRDYDAAWLWDQLKNRSGAARADLLTQLDPLSESLLSTWRDEERPQVSSAILYLMDWRALHGG